ncbi:MAG: hypothetical protein HY319_00945 [Armatimonadetes bacterium]|nr:hypothetical protein [Armatimonadota bacterium]
MLSESRLLCSSGVPSFLPVHLDCHDSDRDRPVPVTLDRSLTSVFECLQTRPRETLLFTHEVLHDASDIVSRDGLHPGHRDILLIDFDPLRPA